MLALRMGRTLDELYATMSSQEFSIWVALYDLDRWGDEQASMQDDFRAGTICATVANFAGKTIKRGSDGLSAADFMPSLAKPKEPVAEVDPVAHFKLLATTQSQHK
jgi:hypothetical protein